MHKNWRELIRPRAILVDQESLTDKYGKFTCEPLERGFGLTLGNGLRRVLLSSIRGAAVTAVRIEGVLHEFSTVPEIEEDVAEIILNLKAVDLRLEVDGPKTIHVRLEGERDVKAKDLFQNPAVTIFNPDLHICSMGPGAVLDIELTIAAGFGYKAAEKTDEDVVGTIPMDAIYTPIRKVNYRVSNARVGQMTDYDKLTIEVWTNGAVSPRDSVALAAKVLKEQLQVFINFPEVDEPVEVYPAVAVEDEVVDSPVQTAESTLHESLYRLVEELDLSVRAQNCLQSAGVRYVGDLVQKTEQEMLKTRNFGRKSLKEIKDALGGMGLSLGMRIEGFAPEKRVLSEAALAEKRGQ